MKLLRDRIISEVSESEILCVAYEPMKKIIASGSFEESIKFHKYPYGKLFKKITHHEKIPILESEDIFAQLDSAESVKAIKDQNGELGESVKYAKGSILSPSKMLFLPKLKYFIIGYSNGEILIFNYQTWKKISTFTFKGAISTLQMVNKEKTLFVATQAWELILIDLPSGKLKHQQLLESQNSGKLVLTDDMKTLFFIADKKRTKAVDFNSLEEKMIYKGHTSGINMIRLSPDEKILCSCGNDCKLALFNPDTGELLSYLIGHSDEVHSFVFSNDGKFIVSSSEDDSLRLWDSMTYKCVKVVKNVPNSDAMELVGDLLVMGNVDGEINTYKMF